MIKKTIPIILAGGQGTRLWPASLPHIPKQFIEIEGMSLMCRTVLRALATTDEEVLIVTGRDYISLFSTRLLDELQVQGADISRIVIIGEPEAKNTAPAIAYALKYVEQSYENPKNVTMLVVTADHLINPVECFVSDAHRAVEAANTGEGYIVTFGIQPTHAETGYGYIEMTEDIVGGDEAVHSVKAFREKPDEELAKTFLAAGNYLWNSGMFCFPYECMRQELEAHSEEITAHILSNDSFLLKTHDNPHFRVYIPEGIEMSDLVKISIDYAVMEHASRVAVVKASFDWNDIGSWDEAADLLQEGQKYLVGADNVTIYSDMPVGIVDVSDIVVVAKEGRILITKKGSAQKVGEIAKLAQRGEDAGNENETKKYLKKKKKVDNS